MMVDDTQFMRSIQSAPTSNGSYFNKIHDCSHLSGLLNVMSLMRVTLGYEAIHLKLSDAIDGHKVAPGRQGDAPWARLNPEDQCSANPSYIWSYNAQDGLMSTTLDPCPHSGMDLIPSITDSR